MIPSETSLDALEEGLAKKRKRRLKERFKLFLLTFKGLKASTNKY